MLQTRLWMGAVLIGLTVGVLTVDQRLGPWHPFWFFLIVALAEIACFEVLRLLPPEQRPSTWLCHAAVTAMLAANWLSAWHYDPWPGLVSVVTAGTLAAFLLEMAHFQAPGHAVVRIALTSWLIIYLGLLPSFLAQLRWLPGREVGQNTLGLALAIFIPKCCDTGAYFTGRFLGRHKMAPVLSPKKTWEGAAGGLLTAMAATVGINRLGPVLPNIWAEIGFGLTVGLAGMLGDLAESLIKRDCQRKDASQVVPGFGGVLDVVDAILFAAPVAYLWLSFQFSVFSFQ